MENKLSNSLKQQEQEQKQETQDEYKLSGKFRQPRIGLRRMPDGIVKRVPILTHQEEEK